MRKPAAALLLVALSLHTACSTSEDSGRGGFLENTPGRYLGTEPKGKYDLDELYSYPIKWGTAPSSVAWSPDGTRISFLWNTEGGRFRDIYFASVPGGELSRLLAIGHGEGIKLQPIPFIAAAGRAHKGESRWRSFVCNI